MGSFDDWPAETARLTEKVYRLIEAKHSKTIKPISSDFFYLKSPGEAKELINLWKTKSNK